ncbi:hypothetical protein [Gimesia maris]|uniref:Transposase n=1 Tax=Gimesia maris TaxID=122 RepID=A0ABX5YKA0_9PLAN|nr:hypothetical protein [Gimesia maris]EDL56753.1 hypothetical protein PM8797T_02474 [Gimesia maris DSM 8797]QDU14098.1 hypothetical protein CA11_19020 [Gimesia maris]QEG16069.1 hypothetical protein GmarT_19300 [Gimesia maris]QGQ30684.1 hypothetical protein F1729_19665 [Gimesia maris]
MGLTEILSYLLAYNLIRFRMLQSGMATGRDLHSLSFTITQQMLAASCLLGAVMKTTEELSTPGQ